VSRANKFNKCIQTHEKQTRFTSERYQFDLSFKNLMQNMTLFQQVFECKSIQANLSRSLVPGNLTITKQ